MKKIFALFVLGIFLLSIVPLSFAKAQTEKRGKAENATISKGPKLRELEFKARAIDKIKLERARANFLEAKEKYLETVAKFNEARLRFFETKRLMKECKDSESEECKRAKEEVNEKAKDFLLRSADAILEHLNKVRSKIESNEDLSDEEATDLLARIDAKISAIQEAKAKIESATTKEEIVEAAKTINAAWKNTKVTAKEAANRLVNARIGGIIVKSERLGDKLERIKERMEKNGKDISEVQTLIDEFNALINDAKNHYNLAIEKFNQAKTEQSSDLIREAQSHMKDAHKALKDAQKKLRDILKSIKEAKGEKEIKETTEDEQETSEDEETSEEEKDEEDKEEQLRLELPAPEELECDGLSEEECIKHEWCQAFYSTTTMVERAKGTYSGCTINKRKYDEAVCLHTKGKWVKEFDKCKCPISKIFYSPSDNNEYRFTNGFLTGGCHACEELSSVESKLPFKSKQLDVSFYIDRCYLELAREEKDESYCSKMTQPADKCYFDLSQIKDNVELCQKIENNLQREICIQLWEQRQEKKKE